MPPHTGRKIIFDTNVYINAIHGGAASKPYRLLFDSLPSTYLCSVVSAELYLGALDFRGIRLIQGFVVRSEKVGRVVTPSHGSWNESARILAKISQKEPKYNSKLTALSKSPAEDPRRQPGGESLRRLGGVCSWFRISSATGVSPWVSTERCPDSAVRFTDRRHSLHRR